MKNIKLFYFLIPFLSLAIFSCDSDDNADDVSANLNCPSDIEVTVNFRQDDAVVIYNTPNAGSGSVTQTAGLPSGSVFPVGTTTNTFSISGQSGDSSTCTFNVTVTKEEGPTNAAPYFVADDPTPTGKTWLKVEELSDEFNGDTFDDSKWHRNPASDGFGWYGRPPALFKTENVTVSNGNMNVAVEKLDAAQTVNGSEYTYGGSIVRSKATAKSGYYYETRMKANATVMSSTFWISYLQNCNNGPVRKLELDIQECVGRTHSGTQAFGVKYDNIFASNTWRHQQPCDTEVDGSKQAPSNTVLNEKNHSRFFVYGCWWKSPTEILFYLDGKFTHSITNPPADFDLEGYITMAIETYDWNPIDSDDLFENGSEDQLTTKYDWIRTWKLSD